MARSSARIRLAPVLWSLALALPCAALGAEGPKITLVPYQPIARQASPELCAQVTNVVGTELGSQDNFILLQANAAAAAAEDPEAAPSRATPTEDPAAQAALDKALKYADAGGKNVRKQKFEPAIKALEEALKLFPTAAPAVVDAAPVAQANLDLAVAYWKRGREDEAMARMADAVRLNPDAKLDPKEYFPLFMSVYDAEWRKTLRKPRGKIRVDATVSGAEVFFDGKSVGATPVMLTNVVAGHHFLRVVKDGAGTFGAHVSVDAEKELEITAELGGSGEKASASLGPVAQAIAGNLVDEAAVTAAQGMGQAAGADFVVFGGVQKKEAGISVASFMVRVKDGKASRLMDVEFDLDLLSASVETFKLVEDVGMHLKEWDGELPPGATPIVRGLEGGTQDKGITEVDVGPPIPEGKKSGTGSSRVERGGDDAEGRVALGGDEDQARKSTATKARRGGLEGGTTTPSDDYEPKKPFYQTILGSPVLLGGLIAGGVAVAVVVVAVAAVAAGGGGFAAWYLASPPQRANVEATWP